MTTSVALCTYNGAKYIEEQLTSILNQTHPVDEIVVCDDGSTDDTLKIIEDIRLQANSNIRVFCNERNIGVQKNFERAISLCNGEIVFLSDQDDIWEHDKVSRIVDWFQKNPSKSVVFGDAYLIDANGDVMPNKTLWNLVEFNKKEQRWFNMGAGLELFLHGNVATGATMAIRKNELKYICCLPDTSIYHDEIIAEVALIDNSLGYISKPLMRYRLHDAQVCGIEPKEKRITAIKPFWYGNRLDMLPKYKTIQQRILFGHERLKSKHYWFGRFVIKHFGYYLKIYGFKCGMVIMASDVVDSYQHSFLRIKNKISHTFNSAL